MSYVLLFHCRQGHVTLCHWCRVRSVYLLCVSLSERQFGGDVEHDLLPPVDGVDGLRARLTVGHVQTPPEPAGTEPLVTTVFFRFIQPTVSFHLWTFNFFNRS